MGKEAQIEMGGCAGCAIIILLISFAAIAAGIAALIWKAVLT